MVGKFLRKYLHGDLVARKDKLLWVMETKNAYSLKLWLTTNSRSLNGAECAITPFIVVFGQGGLAVIVLGILFLLRNLHFDRNSN